MLEAALAALFASLRRGLGGILGTADHWFAVTDARIDTEKRQFLVHDTVTGITGWVSEASLCDGSFQRTLFGWPHNARSTDILCAAPVRNSLTISGCLHA